MPSPNPESARLGDATASRERAVFTESWFEESSDHALGRPADTRALESAAGRMSVDQSGWCRRRSMGGDSGSAPGRKPERTRRRLGARPRPLAAMKMSRVADCWERSSGVVGDVWTHSWGDAGSSASVAAAGVAPN